MSIAKHHAEWLSLIEVSGPFLSLPVLTRAGLSAAPADAPYDVRSRVHWVSRYDGGRGAAREMIEMVLKATDRWNALTESLRGVARPAGRPRRRQGVGTLQARRRTMDRSSPRPAVS